jgi:hypothetical protein
MAGSPYFDGTYFDPTYFDTGPVASSGGGGSGYHARPRRRVMRLQQSQPQWYRDEDLLLIL